MAVSVQHSVAVGVFERQEQTDQAIAALKRAGFHDDEIGFVRRCETKTDDTEVVREAGGEAAKGAVAGGVLGGIIGAAATFLIPGAGTVVAGGLLAEVLGGAVAGAGTGGLAGGFLGAIDVVGVSDEEAGFYDKEFQSCRTIVTVRANSRQDEARQILRRFGGYDIHSGVKH